ncbi:MAG: vitamin K epoxide reductase family protein [archaeon]|nr:vitamin K epoxide reductase family protein [archaeon]
MKKNGKKTLIWVLIILAVLGLFTSFYLIKNHYVGAVSGSACDFNETISCSIVNTSIYSELLGVPVAIFGALWFVVLLTVLVKLLAKKNPRKSVHNFILLGWSILGVLFIVYMVVAEIILKSICPFCTLVHIIVLITFICAIVLYRRSPLKSMKNLSSLLVSWIVLIAIINLIPLVLLNIPSNNDVNYDALAQCINDNGVEMYGSFRCGVCAKSRAMFGDSFQYIKEIECHPQGENNQWALCQEVGIEGTPTWIKSENGVEVKRQQGFMSIAELREFSGCGDI